MDSAPSAGPPVPGHHGGEQGEGKYVAPSLGRNAVVGLYPA
ncbi:MAG: hypothetical protein ABI253_03550 [Mycobacterium sp.]